MTAARDRLEAARQVADAVLFEGYLLYPYRASATKNQFRWQFGVLWPRAYAEAADEKWRSRTEVLLEADDDATVDVRARCLQVQRRAVERALEDGAYAPVDSLWVDGVEHTSWDEAVVQEVATDVRVVDVLGAERAVPCEVPGGEDDEPLTDGTGRVVGRVVRRRQPLRLTLRLAAEAVHGPYAGLARLRLDVENAAAGPAADGGERDEALPQALVAAHVLLAAEHATFISLLEPPQWAAGAVAECHNEGTFPVLVGDGGTLVLSSPIILYDQPAIAPESPGELFDGTEIDEILSLRTLTLTDEEKREARATDARAADIIDRVDTLPPEIWARLHGAARAVTAAPPPDETVVLAGVTVGHGSRVRLRPGARRSDAQDMFLAGRTARVEKVVTDVDDVRYVAVTLEDDAGADLHQWHGRFLYFDPDEVEPVEPAQPAEPAR